MVKATIDDLRLERWLRQRNAGLIVWTCKDGTQVPIKDMSDSHLENAIRNAEYVADRESEMIDAIERTYLND